MRTKEGQMFALTPAPTGEKVEKSQTEGKSFKSVYQKDFAAFGDGKDQG